MQTRSMARSTSPVAPVDNNDPHEEHPREETPPRRLTRAAARAAAISQGLNINANIVNTASVTPTPPRRARATARKPASNRVTKPSARKSPAKPKPARKPARKPAPKKTPAKKTPAKKGNKSSRGPKAVDEDEIGHGPVDIVEANPEHRHALVETENNAAGRSPHDNQNRKRTHDDSTEPPSPKRQQRLACLAAIDRLNSGPAPIPYSARARRRKIESTGRLDKSIFRIPQLIRQQKRDKNQRPAREGPAPTVEQNPTPAPAPAPQESGYLSPWGRLGNLLGDGVRSVSNMISPRQEPVRFTPMSERDLTWSLWPERRMRSPPRRLSRPRSEDDIPPLAADSTTDAPAEATRSLSKAASPPLAVDLTADAPIEVTRSLSKDASPPLAVDLSTDATDISRVEPTYPAPAPTRTSSDPVSANQLAASGPSGQKRKRVIPAVIPNPPGCSYGMHPDYFWYSSDDEDELPVESAKPKPAKRVRFDRSPEDAPSKLRARAREQVRSSDRSFGFDYEAHSSDSEVEREQEKWEESLRLAQKAKKAAGLKPAKKQALAKPVSTFRVDKFKPRLPSGLRSQTGPADDAHGVPSFQWPLAAALEGVPAVQPQDFFVLLPLFSAH